jgi:glycosyl transferase, family 25
MDIPQPDYSPASRFAPLHALYINLDRDVHRDRLIAEQLARGSISGHRLRAIDGKEELPPSVASYFAHVRQNRAPMLAPGAVGCYASHLKAWQQIAAGPDVPMLVLEDDAVLADDLTSVIFDLLAVLPPGWDMVHLSQAPRHAFRPLKQLGCGPTLLRYSRIPFGAAGYLMSRAGARKMLNPAIPRFWAIDLDTRRPWVFGMDVYGVTPPPIRQNRMLPTNIGVGKVRARRGLPRPTAYSWTNLPLHSAAGFVFNMRKLGVWWWLKCFAVNFGLKAMRWAAKVSRDRGERASPRQSEA